MTSFRYLTITACKINVGIETPIIIGSNQINLVMCKTLIWWWWINRCKCSNKFWLSSRCNSNKCGVSSNNSNNSSGHSNKMIIICIWLTKLFHRWLFILKKRQKNAGLTLLRTSSNHTTFTKVVYSNYGNLKSFSLVSDKVTSTSFQKWTKIINAWPQVRSNTLSWETCFNINWTIFSLMMILAPDLPMMGRRCPVKSTTPLKTYVKSL